MGYVWVDGQALEPIGDSLDLWLAFLRGRGALEARLDVSGGTEVCRVVRDGAVESWRPVWGGGIFTLNGSDGRPAAPQEPAIDLASASSRLQRAVEAELQNAPDGVRRTSLERSLAILASPGDGEEVSDVAWPYFILPDGAPTAARRLIASACAAWPEIGAVPDPAAALDRGAEGVEAPLEAIAAAVNSSGAAEPVE
jgi:hypothetical protein